MNEVSLTGYQSVSHALRHEHDTYGQTGDKVVEQVMPVVFSDPALDRCQNYIRCTKLRQLTPRILYIDYIDSTYRDAELVFEIFFDLLWRAFWHFKVFSAKIIDFNQIVD